MTMLRRPITLRGFGDAADDAAFMDLPTTSSGAVDWSQLNLPAAPSFAPSAGAPGDLSSILQSVVTGAQQFYKGKADITTAQTNAALAKINAQNALRNAQTGGLPSPTLLLVGGFALAALFLLKSK